MTVEQLKAHMDRRFVRQDRRIARRFEAVDARLDSVEKTLTRETERRFDSLNDKLDSIERGLNNQINALSKRITSVDASVESRFETHHEILNEHEERVKVLDRAAR